jgi:hypothetical protein
MMQPRPRPGDESSNPFGEEDWLTRHIREHIVRGNRPDYERALEHSRKCDEIAAKRGPSGILDGLSEEQIEELAVKLVREVRREGNLPRHSIAWPEE